MRFFLFAVLLLALGGPARAEAPHHSAARLFSPVTAAGGAETVPVAVEVKLEPGWHAYWRTPGEAGLAPVFDWTGSSNLKSAEVSFPAPRRVTMAELDNYGYEGGIVFPVGVVPEAPGAALDLKLKLDLLICNDICLPETWNLSLSLPEGMAEPSADKDAYDAAVKALPRRQGATFERAYLNFDSSNINYLVVEALAPEGLLTDLDLFVEHPSNIFFGRPRLFPGEDGRILLAAPVRASDPLDRVEKALEAAPLRLTLAGGDAAYEGELPLSARPASATAPLPDGPTPAIVAEIAADGLKIALFAFIGGLILNLMPCVLPVLSLKVLSVVSHGKQENRFTIFRNFTASALGILASFWLMAAALSSLKAAGETIGWGIQFQSAPFLVFLIFVLVLFALNMWGLFEIPLPRFIARNIPAKHEHEPTLAGHFLTGAFATLLATPCTAPFLGTAVGFALSRNAFEIFAVFTMIGLGLAAPYFLLAVSPRLFRFMPKPGKWMVALKKALAVLLLLTAAWLGSVLYRVATVSALDAGWQAFDAALIAPAVAEGKVVVVDITAEWCLTCKANKKLVLDQKDVVDALSGPEILRLQGDWTQRDETIAAYLRKYGRYGIPFNIVYGPGAPDGVVLPELLTKQAVTDALAEAAGE